MTKPKTTTKTTTSTAIHKTPRAMTEATQANYTELSRELSEVLARLEQGDLDVDTAVASYDRGLQIITILEEHLLKAENRVNELKAASVVNSADEEE